MPESELAKRISEAVKRINKAVKSADKLIREMKNDAADVVAALKELKEMRGSDEENR